MIPVGNIYYMLSYAFQSLRRGALRDLATEDFENAQDLCAAILAEGMRLQIKRGLGKGYLPQTDSVPGARGRIELGETIKANSLARGRLVCRYDEFSSDIGVNRIVKSALELLLRSNVPKSRKKEIRGLLPFLQEVGTVNLAHVDWSIAYDRSNQTYRMLMGICRLVADGLLMTQADGTTGLREFFDEQSMHRLYEKFILEYYRREHRELAASASQIPWALDDGSSEMLPVMQTDTTLSAGSSCLIIDAKYYGDNLQRQERYGSETIHSANLYQIFAYVKNRSAAHPNGTVSGMLLYAKTDEGRQLDERYSMNGNAIYVKTLDLSGSFSDISWQLDAIAQLALGK